MNKIQRYKKATEEWDRLRSACCYCTKEKNHDGVPYLLASMDMPHRIWFKAESLLVEEIPDLIRWLEGLIAED